MDSKVVEAVQEGEYGMIWECVTSMDRAAHDLVADMVKQMANEPSVGMYFVQQHVHRAVPAIVSLKEQVLDCVHDSALSTEDAKDALATVKKFKEVGPPVMERMIKLLGSSSQILQASRGKDSAYSVSEMARSAKKLVSSPFKSDSPPPNKPDSTPPNKSDSSTNYAKNIWDSALDRASSFTRRPSAESPDPPPPPLPAEAPPPPPPPPSSTPSPYGYVRSVLESASQRVGSIGWSDPGGSSKPEKDQTPELQNKSDPTPTPTPTPTPAQSASSSGGRALEQDQGGGGDDQEREIIRGDLAEIREGYDRFQAENAAKLAEWLDKP